MFNA
ncbi:hypothetical protein VCHC40A1_1507, partial [Vibrio cholerae HC-40A1]|jgi:hypothetical protein